MPTWINDLYSALIAKDRWQMYLRGFGLTLQITLVALVIGVVLGLIVAVVKVYAKGSKNPILHVLSGICSLYTTIVRGTPMTLQLLIIYGALTIFKDTTPIAYIAFGINSGAYVSEIFRAGINSVDVGQMEAGRSLGLSRNTTMKSVILPQAVKNILPSLFNEIISLLKETSVAGYIAISDLTKIANGIRSTEFTLWPLLIAAVFYLATTLLLTQVQRVLERRFALSDRR